MENYVIEATPLYRHVWVSSRVIFFDGHDSSRLCLLMIVFVVDCGESADAICVGSCAGDGGVEWEVSEQGSVEEDCSC